MWNVLLHWEYCPDGVEIVGEADRRYRYRSRDRITHTYRLTNLEDPVVLHFVNANNDDALLKFLNRFGFPVGFDTESPPLQKIQQVSQLRDGLARLLQRLNADDYRNVASPLNDAFKGSDIAVFTPSIDVSGDTPEIVIRAQSMYVFMLMEIAVALNAGARHAVCEQCGTAFLTGPLTGRRSHAVYCSDRCRAAAMRARKAQAK